MDLREKSKRCNPYGLSVPIKVQKFIKETGLDYRFNIDVDTSYYKDSWRGLSPTYEMCVLILRLT